MNKKLNTILNVTEIISILVIAISMIILARVSILGLNNDLIVLRKYVIIYSVKRE